MYIVNGINRDNEKSEPIAIFQFEVDALKFVNYLKRVITIANMKSLRKYKNFDVSKYVQTYETLDEATKSDDFMMPDYVFVKISNGLSIETDPAPYQHNGSCIITMGNTPRIKVMFYLKVNKDDTVFSLRDRIIVRLNRIQNYLTSKGLGTIKEMQECDFWHDEDKIQQLNNLARQRDYSRDPSGMFYITLDKSIYED